MVIDFKQDILAPETLLRWITWLMKELAQKSHVGK